MSVMGMPPHVRRWANTKDAAAHIGCNAEVLRRWHREGSKPWLPTPRRIGKNLLWDLDELDSAIDSTRAHEERTHAGDRLISEAQVGGTSPRAIEDQELLLDEYGFSHDGTQTA